MSIIDDDTLSAALLELGNSFKISSGASARILEQASSSSAATNPRSLRLRGPSPRRRVVLVGAAVLLAVVAAISVPLAHAENSTSNSFQAIKNLPLGNGSTTPGLVLGNGPQGVSTAGKKVTITGTGAENGSSYATSPKIESVGTISLLETKADVSPAFTKLRLIATHDGGFVNSSTVDLNPTSGVADGTIVLDVPQRDFARLLQQVQKIGDATSVNSNSTDVTGQYVDLTARITSAEASREQYLTIMKRATTIPGILAVQDRLNSIESQIEQLKGQLLVLTNATTYATLTVKIGQAGVHAHSAASRSGVAKAWHDSVRGFVDGFEWLIRIAGPALFALILLAALSGLTLLAWRANRRRRI